MPCDSDHDHAPWPTNGERELVIEPCETKCGWCGYTTPSGHANNLRVHARRHISNTNEKNLKGITIKKLKAGRTRVQSRKVRIVKSPSQGPGLDDFGGPGTPELSTHRIFNLKDKEDFETVQTILGYNIENALVRETPHVHQFLKPNESSTTPYTLYVRMQYHLQKYDDCKILMENRRKLESDSEEMRITERWVDRINRLIAQTKDERVIEELVQSKRILRNIQSDNLLINNLKERLAEAKLALEEMGREGQQYQNIIDSIFQERSVKDKTDSATRLEWEQKEREYKKQIEILQREKAEIIRPEWDEPIKNPTSFSTNAYPSSLVPNHKELPAPSAPALPRAVHIKDAPGPAAPTAPRTPHINLPREDQSIIEMPSTTSGHEANELSTYPLISQPVNEQFPASTQPLNIQQENSNRSWTNLSKVFTSVESTQSFECCDELLC